MATLEKLYHALPAAAFAGALALLAGAGSLACSSLTQPPAPEPMASAAPSSDAGAPPRADAQAPAAQASASAAPPPPAAPETVSIVTVKPGKGPGAQKGDAVSVNYTGTLTDGSKFDSSFDHKPPAPFEFVLGTGTVIQGWEQGILGMKVGEKRKLTIPPSLAYGPRARPGIPANSPLVFDVELMAIKPKK
jgi:FKBP-type peptidyl-prolyl cis-trans isomerase FkpA